MSNPGPFLERLQKAFKPGQDGVVGIVDVLLGLCREQGLLFVLQANQCRVRSVNTEPHELAEIPLQQSVFRAILARVAALCNERTPSSVTPYGGEGELSICTDPPTVFRVAFTNTPGEQRLELRCMTNERGGARDDHVPDGDVAMAMTTRGRSLD